MFGPSQGIIWYIKFLKRYVRKLSDFFQSLKFSNFFQVTVMKIPRDSRKILKQEEGSILENVLLESYIGFSKVFKLLVSLKKPIIAHNALLDLMFIHQQFYKPLPSMYIVEKLSIFICMIRCNEY